MRSDVQTIQIALEKNKCMFILFNKEMKINGEKSVVDKRVGCGTCARIVDNEVIVK